MATAHQETIVTDRQEALEAVHQGATVLIVHPRAVLEDPALLENLTAAHIAAPIVSAVVRIAAHTVSVAAHTVSVAAHAVSEAARAVASAEVPITQEVHTTLEVHTLAEAISVVADKL